MLPRLAPSCRACHGCSYVPRKPRENSAATLYAKWHGAHVLKSRERNTSRRASNRCGCGCVGPLHHFFRRLRNSVPAEIPTLAFSDAEEFFISRQIGRWSFAFRMVDKPPRDTLLGVCDVPQDEATHVEV